MNAIRRVCAKVLLIDPEDRVLLFSGIDRTQPDQPPVWFAVGGAVQQGETIKEAGIRETAEETGLRIGDPGPAVFSRSFHWVFEGAGYEQQETYFLVRTPHLVIAQGGWTDVEKATVVDHRWWSIEDLRRTSDIVYPEDLAALLARLLESIREDRLV